LRRLLSLATLVAFALALAPLAGRADFRPKAPNPSPTTSKVACSKATASNAMTRYGIGVIKPVQPRTPVNQVSCGPFFGRGTSGMIASIAIPGCGISAGWAVFRYAGGTWKLAMNVEHGAFLDTVGGDIRETIGVLARGDAHCFPSSVKYHFWHWNGKRFAAGPWQRAASFDSILTPDRQTWCKFAVYPTPEAFCATRNPVHLATLRTSGKLTVCDEPGCLQNWDEQARVIRNGQANEWNKFHCLVEPKGVTCTVIGGKAAGRGFLINASGVTEVKP
jgi:hypothetical protein